MQNGNYTTEPVEGLRAALELTFIMGSAPLQQQKLYPTRAAAENPPAFATATNADIDSNRSMISHIPRWCISILPSYRTN